MFKPETFMVQKLNYTIMLFYSNINEDSLKARVMIKKFMETYGDSLKITIKEINFELEKELSYKFGVMGTPAVIFLKNGILIRRHFGEITQEEFKSIIKSNYFNNI